LARQNRLPVVLVLACAELTAIEINGIITYWRPSKGASVKALSLTCADGVVQKALLFGSPYSLDELESGDGNGGKPSSSRNVLCLIVAFWIVFSTISNTP
jgi:hypothetical protein